jgi:hypothetical protein
MLSPSRPVFPVDLSVKSATKFIRELTRWVGPGFHPDTDFRDYVTNDGLRTYSDEDADTLNSELEAAASTLERQGIDPCEIGLPIQQRMILQMRINSEIC